MPHVSVWLHKFLLIISPQMREIALSWGRVRAKELGAYNCLRQQPLSMTVVGRSSVNGPQHMLGVSEEQPAGMRCRRLMSYFKKVNGKGKEKYNLHCPV